MRNPFVYKICSHSEWHAFLAAGHYGGNPDDQRDGFVHLSTAAQVPGTLSKHFGGQNDLVLLQVSVAALGEALVFEPSRGGQLFPHLYAALPLTAIVQHWLLPDPRTLPEALLAEAEAQPAP